MLVRPTCGAVNRQLSMSEKSIFESRIVSSPAEFRALRDRWNELADQSSIFLGFDWCSAAWEWAKENAELFIVVVERDEEVVGILPLTRRIDRIAGLRAVVLEFLDVPDTQECDAILDNQWREEIAREICLCLMRDSGWHVLRLHRLPPDSFVGSVLEKQMTASGLPSTETVNDKNLLFSLDGTWEEYYARRSRRLKKGNNLIANRLAKNFDETVVNCAHLSELNEVERQTVLHDLVSVSSRSWKGEETGTSFATTGPREFLEALSQSPMIRQVLVWRLFLDGECVATEFQLVGDATVYALRSDFDSAYQQDSPGTYLNKEILQRLFETEYHEYRMGPGSNTYKLRWSEDEVVLSELRAYSKGMYGKWIRLQETILRPLAARFGARWRQLQVRLKISPSGPGAGQ